MIASSDHKGEKPSGYIAVQVTFDTGFNPDKLYTYWVPSVWRVQPGDKLEVFVSHSTGHKWTTVRFVGGLTLRGAEHKCATRYKAMPLERKLLKEMDFSKLEERAILHGMDAASGYDDTLFLEIKHADPLKHAMGQLEAYRQKFDFKGTATGRVAVSNHPLQDNIPKESTVIDIKNVTYLNGKPFENCTDDELFAAIRKDEAEINGLLKIENKPKALKDRVTKLEAGIKALVAMMDARP